MKQTYFSFLMPYTCLLCGNFSNRKQDLCTPCFTDLPRIERACPRCAKSIPSSQKCGDCLKTSPPFDKTFTLFAYETPITSLIMQLKFNHALINARLFGELLLERVQNFWYATNPLPELIIPMPLHPARLKERGFNQSVEIARPLQKHLNICVDITNCKRIKNTLAQATLPAAQRYSNIKNAFAISHDLSGKHIAVIDDVITTGHTITEFCRTLKQAGAQSIDVWCCARPYF